MLLQIDKEIKTTYKTTENNKQYDLKKNSVTIVSNFQNWRSLQKK